MFESEGAGLEQNTIAVIWDFDKTLIKGYMQEPIFRKYGVDSDAFWKEVNALKIQYEAQGIQINKDTIYLNHFITCAEQGIFGGLNNKVLSTLGKELEFYPGVPDIFDRMREHIASNDTYSKFGIHVEHYIVSTGLSAMIRGSAVCDHVDGIWGCEFIETPIASELNEVRIEEREPKQISQIAYFIDNTTKTRAVYEINKGSNRFSDIDVNSKIEENDRRVPFDHMIYIADGPSDVPVFSLLQQRDGKTFAIYPKGDDQALEQVDALREDGRIDMYAQADYSQDTEASDWLMKQTDKIANRIYEKLTDAVRKSASPPPKHLNN